MFEAFIITLREGIEAGLILSLILAVLNSMGRGFLKGSVFFGMWVACLFSVLFAWLLQRFSVNEEAFEGITMWVSALLVAGMLVWMWRQAPKMRGTISDRLSRMVSEEKRIFHWGLFLFSFFMIFREGVEVVLFLSAVQLTNDDMSTLLGGISGLVVAVLFSFGLVKGSIRIDLKRFFTATSLVLVVFLVQIMIAGTHELAEAGWIPMTREWMHRLGPFIRYEYLFSIGIVLFPTLLLILPAKRAAPAPSVNPAEGRLARYQERWGFYGRLLVGIFGLSSSVLVIAHAISQPELTLSAPILVSDKSSRVEIPIAQVSDGNLHRFLWTGKSGERVRFIIMKIEENTYGTAIDACELCGPSGYAQERRGLVCLNCAADLVPASLGRSGGCNPITLKHEKRDGLIVIRLEELLKHARLFHSKA